MEDEDEKNAQIEDYLSKNQGADDDSKDIGDNETASPEIATAVPQIAAAAPVAPTAAALPPTTDDASKIAALKAYLTPMYSPTKDDAAIAAARDQSNNQNFIANIGQALGNIATANSRAHGGQGVDPGVFQSIRQQGQQGLASAISAKQNNVADFLRNHELERQMAQDKMTQGTYEQRQAAAKLLADQNDPESDASSRAVESAQATFPDKAQTFDGLSANEVAKALKGVEVKDKTDTSKALRMTAQQHQQDVADAKKTAVDKQNAVKDFQGLSKDLDADLSSSRTSLGQANNKIIGAQRVMTFADVTPDQLDQAKNDPALMQQLKTKLNSLTPQQYTEVVSGLMSQVAPGSGSLGQLEHMRANTAEQTAANLKQYFTSQTAPANMGDMLLNNLMTLKNEQDTSKAVINNHIDKMQAKHPMAFTHEDTADQAKSLLSKYQGGDSIQQASQNDPNQAMKWAKENPNDPRSKKILERLGTMNAGL